MQNITDEQKRSSSQGSISLKQKNGVVYFRVFNPKGTEMLKGTATIKEQTIHYTFDNKSVWMETANQDYDRVLQSFTLFFQFT